ncbi:MAG: hypothetical protein D3925_03625 [Candidatus Electrothrix sp. AR5]|nr:hypothetical protein [Candidatus Electrothrix sp. AR5]
MSETNFSKTVLDANPFIAYVISNHLWIEHLMILCLQNVLPNPDAIFRSRCPSFALLVNLCEAHRIIEPDFANVLRKVNALRNKFAHRMSFEPDLKEAEALLGALKNMNEPFLLSFVPASEREMAIALASISGYLEKLSSNIGSKDSGAA